MRRLSKRTIFISVLALALIATGVYLWHRHTTNDQLAKTTSTSKTAQNDYTGGDNRTSNNSGGAAQGGAKDNHGDSASTPGETGITSTSGTITLVAPISGSSVGSGDVLRGTATGISQVQYRVIDNQVGLLAQGTLQVVDGTYSGTLQFTARSNSGRIDVYSYNAQGQEINEVQVPVTLKS